VEFAKIVILAELLVIIESLKQNSTSNCTTLQQNMDSKTTKLTIFLFFGYGASQKINGMVGL
jgi:hypothetical protein